MAKSFIEFQNLSFVYESMSKPLLTDISVRFDRGWTGIIGANGSGKTTLMKLATNLLQPNQGSLRITGDAIYCAQRTDQIPDGFQDLLQAMDGEAWEIRGRLEVEEQWLDRWETLSHGERKRAQIATALWRQPSILAIDEPTNHLDRESRQLLTKGLERFGGVGLLVSHDRELLDSLCKKSLFLEPPGAQLRTGTIESIRQQIALEDDTALKEHEIAKRELKKLERKANKHREEAGNANKKRSKRKLDKKDSDGRAKINMARVTGKDAVQGKLLNQINGRRRQAQSRLNEIVIKKRDPTGIWQSGECSRRSVLFNIPAEKIPLGKERMLSIPNLILKPTDRVSITGANGAGKSTLLGRIISRLELSEEKVIYLPQEVGMEESRHIKRQVEKLSGEKLGTLMTIVSRLGSNPSQLLESELPSPGEVRKLLLAFGIIKVPHLIIMDEPTNHLDLPSIESLEEALIDFPAALLLVSHDRRFLGKLTTTNWHLSRIEHGQFSLNVDHSI